MKDLRITTFPLRPGLRTAALAALLSAVAAACGGGGDTNGTGGKTTTTTTTTTSETGGTGGTGTGGTGGSGGMSTTTMGCGTTIKGPTRGSAIAITSDDSRLVVVNRETNSVTVLSVDYADGQPKMSVVKEIQVGGEPWQVAINGCDDTAYVVLRKDQKLVEITGINTASPAKGRELGVGSEPTAVAISPNNTRVYVANWVNGTLTVVDPINMTSKGDVDLNATLANDAKKYLGTVAPRPSLAHPRSIAITNNGDASDEDEHVYVTEFYAQQIVQEAADGSNADVNRAGLVYHVKVADNAASIIELGPIADTGFPANGKATGCFPNQLQSITINGDFAYVSSTCASPVGPVAAKNNTHPAVSVINVKTNQEVSAGTTNLDKNFDAFFVAQGTADDGARRMPHAPSDIAFLPGSAVSYVAANGADAAFRVRYDPATSAVAEVGAGTGNPLFINLSPGTITDNTKKGQNPIGIVIGNTHANAFVANDVTRNVSAIDLAKQIVAGSDAATNDPRATLSTPLPTAANEISRLRGKHFFNTGLGRWSLNGQAWGSCQACHVDGLTDNVTWYFARGPRQSIDVSGTFSKTDPNDTRVMNWTAIFDEMADFENNTRGVSGGVGALVSANSSPPNNADRLDLASAALFPPAGAGGLNGSTIEVTNNNSVLKDWNDITLYTKTIRAPRAPNNLDAAKVAAGEALFKNEGSCQGCHGGSKWTISKVFFTPSGANNEALKTKTWTPPAGFPAALLPATTTANQLMRFGGANPGALDQLLCVLRPVGTFGVSAPGVGIAEVRADMTTPAQGNATDGKGFNPPSLLGVQTGAPYFHAGNARTLEEAFASTFGAHWKALAQNVNFLLPAGDTDKLIAYILSIDETKPTVAIPTPGATGGDFCAFP
jgi:DNA-binding beta-propeller fold protein YncE/mono/diheme cytochrome c family protein